MAYFDDMGGADYDCHSVLEYARGYLGAWYSSEFVETIANSKMVVDGYETKIDRYFAAADQ